MSNTRNLADLLDSSGDIKSAALDNVDVSGKLDTSGGTLTGTLTMESTDAGSTAAPELILYRNSASPADGDYLGQVQFKGENDNGGSEIYAKVTGKITDASNGTEDGLIETAIKGNGSFTIVSRQKSDELQLLNGVNLNVDGNITVGGTVDGVDIQTLNTTAGAALPKAGGTMTGTIAGFTSAGIDDNADATAMTIDSSERIGIGTASPNARLHVYNANDHTRLKVECAQNSGQAWMFQSRNNGEFWIRNDSGSGTNPVVIGSDGRVAISQTGNATAMQVSTSVAAETTAIFQGGGTGAVDVVDVRDGSGNTKFKVRQNGQVGMGITPSASTAILTIGAAGNGAVQAGIDFDDTNTGNTHRVYNNSGQLYFRDATAGSTRMVIKDNGYIGINDTAPQGRLNVTETSGNWIAIFDKNNTSNSTGILVRTGQHNQGAHSLISVESNHPDCGGSSTDAEFKVFGDGDVACDGAFSGGGADYAEYFESSTGAALTYGNTVKLNAEGKVVQCGAEETPIGVIRPDSATGVIGNNPMNWKNKYLRDGFGVLIRDEDDNAQLNPDFNPDLEYVMREDRPEWNAVGLMGQVPITKGQPTASNWIKMWEINSTLEMWFIK